MSKNMVLQSLVLENFKKHRALELEFSPTVTAIRGPNYAGKSSSLQAVFFALFGANSVPGGKATLATAGESNCKVSLYFDLDGERGVITRTLNTASVHVNDVLVASGHTSVTEWVENVFGMDYKNVLRLANSSQGETSALLTLGVTALNRVIEDVSNVSYVDELMDRAGEIASKANAQLSALPAEEDLEQKAEEINKIELELGKLEFANLEVAAEFSSKEEEYKACKLQLSQALTHNKEAVQSKLKAKELNQALETLLSLTAEIEAELSSLKELPHSESVIREADETVERLDQELREMSASAGQRKALESRLTKLVKWASSEYLELKAKEEKWRPEFLKVTEAKQEAEQTAKNFHAAVAAQTAKVQSLEKEANSSECPTCKRPYDGKAHSHALQSLEQAKKALTDIQAEYESAKQDFLKLARQLKTVELELPPTGWELQAEANLAELEDCKAKLENVPEVDESKEAKLKAEKQQAVKAAAAAREVSGKVMSLELRLSKAVERKEAIEQKKSEHVEIKEIDTSELIKAQEVLEKEYNELSAKASGISSGIKMANYQLTQMNAAYERAKTSNEKRKQCEVKAARFTAFKTWLRNNKAAFMQETWRGLMSIVSQFTYEVTGGRVESVERAEDGTFWFVENGNSLPVDGCASGGQKSIMGVALRLALASLLPQGCRFVVLDEPSAELNDEHAAALSGALRTQERQVILVTHREGDEFASDAVITLG